MAIKDCLVALYLVHGSKMTYIGPHGICHAGLNDTRSLLLSILGDVVISPVFTLLFCVSKSRNLEP